MLQLNTDDHGKRPSEMQEAEGIGGVFGAWMDLGGSPWGDGVKAVSYTHLDVYKRQPMTSAPMVQGRKITARKKFRPLNARFKSSAKTSPSPTFKTVVTSANRKVCPSAGKKLWDANRSLKLLKPTNPGDSKL